MVIYCNENVVFMNTTTARISTRYCVFFNCSLIQWALIEGKHSSGALLLQNNAKILFVCANFFVPCLFSFHVCFRSSSFECLQCKEFWHFSNKRHTHSNASNELQWPDCVWARCVNGIATSSEEKQIKCHRIRHVGLRSHVSRESLHLNSMFNAHVSDWEPFAMVSYFIGTLQKL